MSFDSVPWAVGGGAVHSPEIARLLAYAATSGAEGVVAPSDFRVSALPTPGSAVRIAAGGAVIRNRYAGASQQSYVGRASTVTDLPISPTSGSGGRVDLVIARVTDPQYGGSAPADVAVGPYFIPDIIQNVAAGSTALPAGTAYPAVVLARIDIPPSTATITSGMVTDLRQMGMSKSDSLTLMAQPYTGASAHTLLSTTFLTWPNAYTPTVSVPDWATHFSLVANVSGIAATGGSAVGNLRVWLGSIAGLTTNYDTTNVTDGNRVSQRMLASGALGALVGTNALIKIEGLRSAGPGSLRAQAGTTIDFDLRFSQRVT